MTGSNASRLGTEPLRVEVIDDRGDVVEAVYVNEITGVRVLPDVALARLRGTPPTRSDR